MPSNRFQESFVMPPPSQNSPNQPPNQPPNSPRNSTGAKHFSAVRCIGGALRYMMESRRDLLILATPPVIGLSIIGTLVHIAVPNLGMTPEGTPIGGPATLWAILGLFALNVAFYIMFAVAWHRRFLLPDEVVTVSQALSWRPEKSRFLLFLILIALLVFMTIMALGAFMPIIMMAAGQGPGVAGIGVMVTLVAVAMLFARLALVLPAAAIGLKDFKMRDSWMATKGHSISMFLVVLLPTLIAVVASLPVLMVAQLFGDVAQTWTGSTIAALIAQALNYFAIALGVSSLSIAFTDLVGTGRR